MALKLCVASVNLQHWIKAGGVMIDGKPRSSPDYESKLDWAQRTFASIQPDILGVQEVYDQESFEAIFTHPALQKKHYTCHLSGGTAPQQVGLATTLPLDGPIDSIQSLTTPIVVRRAGLEFSVDRLSRPILKARLRHEGGLVTVFVAHLKSKLPSFGDDPKTRYPEEDLLTADMGQRSLGALASLARRGAEAAALRREIVTELQATDNPVIVLGDLNGGPDEVTSEMLCGDRVSAYIPTKADGTRYSPAEVEDIRRRLHRVVLTSAQEIQIKDTALAQLYTSIFDGKYTSLDHVLLSRHFFRLPPGVVDPEFKPRYYFNYFEVLNDHLVDRDPQYAPRKPMTTDHGVAVAYLKKVAAPAPDGSKDTAAETPSDLQIR